MSEIDQLKIFECGLKKDVKDKWAPIAAFTGIEGVGKTTCMFIAASGYHKLIKRPFDMEKQTSFMPKHEEVKDKFYALKSGDVYVIDEAMKVLDKQDWANNLQKTIRQMYATERKQCKITFLGMPRFSDFAERFRNHSIQYWFNIIARGVCVVRRRDNDPDLGFYDPWHIKDNVAMKLTAYGRRSVVERSLQQQLDIERRLPNYWFDFRFDALPPDVEAQYLTLVSKYKAKAEQEDSAEEVIENNKVWLGKLLSWEREKGITIQKLSEITGAGADTISNRIKWTTGLSPRALLKLHQDNGQRGITRPKTISELRAE